MARVHDAAVLGLLAGLVVMTATDAFLQPLPQNLMRQQPCSLSEAATLGAWRSRPGRGGVVLHARWPFGWRGKNAEKEEGKQDTAQQVRCCSTDRDG